MLPNTPLTRRLLRILSFGAVIIIFPLMILVVLGAMGLFFTFVLGMLALCLVLALSVPVAVKIFGSERVQRALRRLGITVELDPATGAPRARQESGPRDANGDVIEDAVVIEDIPPKR